MSTVSFWFKKVNPEVPIHEYIFEGYHSGSNRTVILADTGTGGQAASDEIVLSRIRSGAFYGNGCVTPTLRDPSAWYHICYQVTSDTSGGSAVAYLNGVEVDRQEVIAAGTYPYYPWWVGSTVGTFATFGRYTGSQQNWFNGYLAEVHCTETIQEPN